MFDAVIFEDDSIVAKVHQKCLKDFSQINVSGVFSDGKTGLDFIFENKPDLLVMDISLPIMDGLEVLKTIRSKNLKIEVIVVTANNDTNHLDEFLQLGILDYLVKPFEIERLRLAIKKFIYKNAVFASQGTVSQEDIDKLLITDTFTKIQLELPKGLQQQTYEIILTFLKNNEQKYYSCEQLSEQLRLSTVTIRRYLNYFVDQKILSKTIHYETGGRPSILYRYEI